MERVSSRCVFRLWRNKVQGDNEFAGVVLERSRSAHCPRGDFRALGQR
ncbi:MAG: hypothetical protein M3251_02410 [Thermoproteota archaeon]|nr:hypothetical protein [Thermoproteota archaeon]